MNSLPIAIRDLDIKNVTLVQTPAKPGRNPSINLKYNGQNLQIRVPRTAFPGGVLVRDGDNGNLTYTLIGSLKGNDHYAKERSEGKDDMQLFYNFLLDLQELIIKRAVEESVKWFGKKRSEDVIRDAFKSIISVSTDKVNGEYVPNGKYPPSYRVKIPVYDNKVSSDIVDGKRNPVYATPESLISVFPKGIEANLVISGSIYVIAGGGFGVTWRLTHAQVFPQARVTAASIFETEDDDDEIASVTKAEKKPAAAGAGEDLDYDEYSGYGGGAPEEEETSKRSATPVKEEAAPAPTPAAPRKRRVAAGSS